MAKTIAQKLNLKRYSLGDLQRQVAEERGITIHELSELEIKDDTIDRDLDDYQKTLGEKEDNFVIDGRLSWHFIPNSIKIFLEVSDEEAARRIFEACKEDPARETDMKSDSIELTKKLMIKRSSDDNTRYQQMYGIVYDDPKNFDLVIDTTHIPAERVVEKIIDYINEK